MTGLGQKLTLKGKKEEIVEEDRVEVATLSGQAKDKVRKKSKM